MILKSIGYIKLLTEICMIVNNIDNLLQVSDIFARISGIEHS